MSSNSRRAHLLLVISLSLAAVSPQSLSQSTWSWLNPLPQGNGLSGMDFVDANNGFAVGKRGAAIRTTDGGVHWTSVSTMIAQDLHDISFGDLNTGIAVGDSGTILRTTNKGGTWEKIASGTTATLNSVCMADRFTGYIGGGDFFPAQQVLLKTKDGGQSWWPLDPGTGVALNTASVCFTDSATGTAVGSTSAGTVILRSTDGGRSWSPQTSPAQLFGLKKVSFINALQGIIIGGGSGSVLMTTNGGSSWDDRSIPGGGNLDDVVMIGTGSAMVVGSSGNIYRTDNGGMNWAHLVGGGIIIIPPVIDYTTIEVPGGNVAVVGGLGGELARSTDGGVTWERRDQRVTEADLGSILFCNATTGFILGREFMKSTDGGATWNADHALPSATLRGMSFATPDTGFIAGSADNDPQSLLLRTTDGGISWAPIAHGTTNALNGVQFINATTGWITGSGGTIMRTTDGGVTWDPQTSGTTSALGKPFFVNTQVGVVLGSAEILRTTDGGAHWSSTPEPSTLLFDVDFADENVGMIVGVGPGYSSLALRTTNGGVSWSDKSPAGTFWRNGVDVIDANTAVTVGYFDVLRTTDGGNTWRPEFAPNPKPLTGVAFTSATTGFAAGEEGTILRYVSTGPTGVPGLLEASLPVRSRLYQNYPNPFNPLTTIVYELDAPQHVVLELFTLLGQSLATLASGSQSAGVHSVRFDGSRLASGAYFVRLAAGGVVETRRIMLLK